MGRLRNPRTLHHHFRGVTISLYLRRRGNWEAGYTLLGHGRQKAYGVTERSCREAAEAKIRDGLDRDVYAARRDEETARELLKASGVSMTEAARFYLSHHHHPETLATLAEVRDFWLAKVGGGRKGASHYHHHRSLAYGTARLHQRFGDQQISTITVAQLTHFQDELELELAPRTARNSHDAAQALFIFARKRGYLTEDRLTVAERLDRPTVGRGKKGIFFADQMQRMIDTAWGNAMSGAVPLVVTAFASTRSEEACKQDPEEPLEHRIQWQDIVWDEDYIDIRDQVAKTREPRQAGLPENLKAMLMPLRASGPLYPGKRLDLAFAAIAQKAGVQWVFNGLRHSCLTYDMLLSPNAVPVANRAGNSVEMIERHYRNTKAKREQAVEWFQLRPQVAWGAYLVP